jgi:clan AA aspartic protease
MNGIVTAHYEPTLSLVILGPSGNQQSVRVLLDTGFSEYLTLPPALIAKLGLVWVSREQALMADGSVRTFDVYEAEVIWDGVPRQVEVEAVDDEPLLGMALLQNHEVKLQVVPGGVVDIVPFP